MAKKRRRPKPRRDHADAAASRLAEKRTRWLPWICFAVTLFVFLPAVGNDFVNWDDDRNFLENPYYRGLTPKNLQWMFTTFHLGHYHPLTWLTLGLDFVFWGMEPAGYHFTNILLHAATAVLVYFLFLELLRLGSAIREDTPMLRIAAAFGALLFAIHPLRVESVAWISERRDVLSGLFYIGSILLYLRGRLAGSVAVFAAALLSKIIVATLPIVLIVLDVYPLRKKPSAGLLVNKIPYFALALAAGFFALSRQRTGVTGTFADIEVEPLLRVTMSLYGLAFYLWKTLFPFNLVPQYVSTAAPAAWEGFLLAGSLATVAITALVLVLRRNWPWALAAWACYVVTLLPVLSFLRYDPQQYVADHHSYLATLGFAALAGGLFLKSLHSRQVAVVGVCAALITLFLCERTIAQISVWQDSATLWTHTLRVSPQSIVAHNNLGRALAEQGKAEEAIRHFQRAVEIKRDYAHAHYNLGNLLMKMARLSEAEEHFRSALDREPRYTAALNGLGNCLVRQGREKEAEPYYQRALEVEPGFAHAHYNLALTLHRQQKLDQAEQHYSKAVELDSQNADAHNNWGVLLESRGRVEEAIEHYRKALAIEPNHQDARRNLNAAMAGAATGRP